MVISAVIIWLYLLAPGLSQNVLPCPGRSEIVSEIMFSECLWPAKP